MPPPTKKGRVVGGGHNSNTNENKIIQFLLIYSFHLQTTNRTMKKINRTRFA